MSASRNSSYRAIAATAGLTPSHFISAGFNILMRNQQVRYEPDGGFCTGSGFGIDRRHYSRGIGDPGGIAAIAANNRILAPRSAIVASTEFPHMSRAEGGPDSPVIRVFRSAEIMGAASPGRC
jgi:hypothetical protein